MNAEHEKTFTIIVGQDEHKIEGDEVSYNQIVSFYLEDGGVASNEYLIKFSQGPSTNSSGTLAPGNVVKVKNGMHFRVSGTGES